MPELNGQPFFELLQGHFLRMLMRKMGQQLLLLNASANMLFWGPCFRKKDSSEWETVLRVLFVTNQDLLLTCLLLSSQGAPCCEA